MHEELIEEKIPTKMNFLVWKRIFRYIFKYWYLFVIMVLSISFTSFYDASLIPLINKAAYTSLRQYPLGDNISNMIIDVKLFFNISFTLNYAQYVALLFGSMILRVVSIVTTFFIASKLGVRINLDIRKDGFLKLQQLSFSYYDKTSSGWLISRMQNDTTKISEILSWGIIRVFWIFAELMFTLITMFSMSVTLSLLILATSPIIILIAPYFQRTMLTLSRKARNAYSYFVGWLAECIAGSKTIKTLSIEKETEKETDTIIEDMRVKSYRAAKRQTLFQPIVNIVASGTTALLILVGKNFLPFLADGTTLDVALLILFIGFISSIYNPIAEFSEMFGEIMNAQVSVEKIISLIDTVPDIEDKNEVVEKYGTIFKPKVENYEAFKGQIVYKNVSFSYLPGVQVLNNINLTIEEGTSLALVGETGSGKSTLVNLLLRFYQPSEGEITIDNVNYQDRSLGWLRSNLGYVAQTPFIFSGSIYDNIRYGKLNATPLEVENAAKTVGIHDFITSLPTGYNTLLSDSGSELSVGQKQLISFARALIRDPRILVLDEATSSIDTQTEMSIQSAIDKTIVDRTSILIAHRLSTIINCDRILVIDQGSIVEDGNHSQLMALKGRYYELYMNQFKEMNIDKQLLLYKKQNS